MPLYLGSKYKKENNNLALGPLDYDTLEGLGIDIR